MPHDAPPPPQPKNPLHGITLQALLSELQTHYGWPGLAERVPVRCFTHEPSLTSSLKFLRKTPWARAKVEALYLSLLRERRRAARRAQPWTGSPAVHHAEVADGEVPAEGVGGGPSPEEGGDLLGVGPVHGDAIGELVAPGEGEHVRVHGLDEVGG